MPTLYILLRHECCMVKVKRILVILFVFSCCPLTETCQSTGCMGADHEAVLFENAKQKTSRYDLLLLEEGHSYKWAI